MKDKKGKSASGLAAGLTKQEGFTPHDSSPPESKFGRPQHDNSRIKRHASTPKI